MAVDEPGSGVTDLAANACWDLLRSQEVGRLAVRELKQWLERLGGQARAAERAGRRAGNAAADP